jgi:hypothetical protein
MGRRAVSNVQRQQLLEAFREAVDAGSPASFRAAARSAGVDWRTAKKAWLQGAGGRPMRDIVAGEKFGVRAALRREELAARLEEATALAREDAIEIRTQQARPSGSSTRRPPEHSSRCTRSRTSSSNCFTT